MSEPITREGAIIRNQRGARSFMNGYLAAMKKYGASAEEIADVERAIEKTRVLEAEAQAILEAKRHGIG